MADYNEIAAVIADVEGTDSVHVYTNYIDITNVSCAIGGGLATRIYDETDHILLKAMHSSDLGVAWNYDESGYRVWFADVSEPKIDDSTDADIDKTITLNVDVNISTSVE